MLANHILAATDCTNRELEVWPSSLFECGHKFDIRNYFCKMES